MSSQPNRPVDITGPSIEEAIEAGLAQLGLKRNEVIIEIVEEGSRGVLGMGARDAQVRLTPLRAPAPPPQPRASEPTPVPQPAREPDPTPRPPLASPALATPATPADQTEDRVVAASRAILEKMLKDMELRATIHVYQAAIDEGDSEAPWVLDIHGADLGSLIGRKGETLDALQYLTRLIASRELAQRVNVVLDVESYKRKRETALRKLAERMAEQAKRMGRTVTLEPMPPHERRIIHMALRGDSTVTTESVGAGDRRKVTISPVVHQ